MAFKREKRTFDDQSTCLLKSYSVTVITSTMLSKIVSLLFFVLLLSSLDARPDASVSIEMGHGGWGGPFGGYNGGYGMGGNPGFGGWGWGRKRRSVDGDIIQRVLLQRR